MLHNLISWPIYRFFSLWRRFINSNQSLQFCPKFAPKSTPDSAVSWPPWDGGIKYYERSIQIRTWCEDWPARSNRCSPHLHREKQRRFSLALVIRSSFCRRLLYNSSTIAGTSRSSYSGMMGFSILLQFW